jgi:hypothetical protein
MPIVPNRMQVTLVSFHGDKPSQFATLIRNCQNKLLEWLKSAFLPYHLDQVHGTIVGLEGWRFAEKIQNKNFLDLRNETRLVDPAALLEFVRSDKFPSIPLFIGGYRSGVDYGFESREKDPYERSFSFQKDIAVAMGWPTERSKPLNTLRRQFTTVNVLHKEHPTTHAVDDDYYFVLGRVDRRFANDTLLEDAAESIRGLLASEVTPITLSRNALSIVAYFDTQLPLGTSCRFSVTDGELDASALLDLYPFA